MTASDNLSAQLFHGSGHDFKVGDVVEPRFAYAGYGAYATERPESAANFARDKERLAPDPDYNSTGLPEQGRLFGTVYKVEPLEGDDPEREDGTAVSQEGFRVTGIHSHAIPDWTKRGE